MRRRPVETGSPVVGGGPGGELERVLPENGKRSRGTKELMSAVPEPTGGLRKAARPLGGGVASPGTNGKAGRGERIGIGAVESTSS